MQMYFLEIFAFFCCIFFAAYFLYFDGKDIKKLIILTSQRCAKHLFIGQNTQHVLYFFKWRNSSLKSHILEQDTKEKKSYYKSIVSQTFKVRGAPKME